MDNPLAVLGVIPARGGSRSIPRKNIAPVGGRPLLAYTCEAALASARLSRVVLSTDDEEIAAVGRRHGVEIPFLRAPALAGDTTGMLEVLQDVVARLEADRGMGVDVVVLLQPTSPLRGPHHIDAAVDLLVATGADSVVSVTEVPHQFGPGSLMRIEGDRLLPLTDGPPVLRRQDKPRLFARNGPAVLATRRDVLMHKGSLYGDDCRALVMDAASSVDVDGPFDLALAEFLLTRRRAEAGGC